MFLADVLPLQREDFISPRPCKRKKANCSDYPRRASLVLLRLAQGVTEPRQLRLAQETLMPTLAVLLNVPAGIRAIGPQAMLLCPSEKLEKAKPQTSNLEVAGSSPAGRAMYSLQFKWK